MQEALLGLWRAPERFDPSRASLATFLLTLTHRRAVDVLRREALQRRGRVATDEGLAELPSADAGTAEQAEAQLAGAEVRQALKELPAPQREALLLAYFQGYTQREISALTGAPLGTVKTRMLAGVRALRAALGSRYSWVSSHERSDRDPAAGRHARARRLRGARRRLRAARPRAGGRAAAVCPSGDLPDCARLVADTALLGPRSPTCSMPRPRPPACASASWPPRRRSRAAAGRWRSRIPPAESAPSAPPRVVPAPHSPPSRPVAAGSARAVPRWCARGRSRSRGRGSRDAGGVPPRFSTSSNTALAQALLSPTPRR